MAGGISFFWGDWAMVAFWPWAAEECASAAANARVRMRCVERGNTCLNFTCALNILPRLACGRLAALVLGVKQNCPSEGGHYKGYLIATARVSWWRAIKVRR